MAENNAIKGLYTLIIMLLCNVVIGQGNIKKEGEEYFKNEKYAIALNFFDRVKDANEDNEILYKRAICNYHINKLSLSKGQLTQALKKALKILKSFITWLKPIMHRETMRWQPSFIKGISIK